jgi:hypothetical protein
MSKQIINFTTDWIQYCTNHRSETTQTSQQTGSNTARTNRVRTTAVRLHKLHNRLDPIPSSLHTLVRTSLQSGFNHYSSMIQHCSNWCRRLARTSRVIAEISKLIAWYRALNQTQSAKSFDFWKTLFCPILTFNTLRANLSQTIQADKWRRK